MIDQYPISKALVSFSINKEDLNKYNNSKNQPEIYVNTELIPLPANLQGGVVMTRSGPGWVKKSVKFILIRRSRG
jgi:hypothetical protein